MAGAGAAGAGVTAGAGPEGACWAATGTAAARPPTKTASNSVREPDSMVVMAILPGGVVGDALRPFMRTYG